MNNKIKIEENTDLKIYCDVNSLIEENGKDDDIIEFHNFISETTKYNIEMCIAIDPVVPISQKQLSYLHKTAVWKSSYTKSRKELTEKEWRMIYRCQFINPSNHE